MFLGSTVFPQSKGVRHHCPHFYGTATCACMQYQFHNIIFILHISQNSQILHLDQTWREKSFYRVYPDPGPVGAASGTKIFVTQMLMCNFLFMIVKLSCRCHYVHHSFCCRGTGIRGLMRGMATLPKVTRSY